ncbi:hypothetical protein B0J13DRAFT_237871 [Dactylonectria estremocensis]|uniref:Secreted protein n=1 Tax=Dactylonectria estremocensis TaxID=1079267 RepID=A0A9P9D989_9HYPO|nr:hypothetical protein B0J13DRAFT_237871 [Dactylonectria estremocensis]
MPGDSFSLLRAFLTVSSLSSSSLASAAAMSAGILLPTKSLSRAFDTSMMPPSDGQRDCCTYRLYGSHWLGTLSPLTFVVLVPYQDLVKLLKPFEVASNQLQGSGVPGARSTCGSFDEYFPVFEILLTDDAFDLTRIYKRRVRFDSNL